MKTRNIYAAKTSIILRSKQPYIPPYIEMFTIETEEGIATNSVAVVPGGGDSSLEEQWLDEGSTTIDVPWEKNN